MRSLVAQPAVSLTLPRAGWLLPAVAAGLFQLLLMAVYAARFHGDVSVFVCAGSDFAHQWPLEHVHASLSRGGFDGQYYYVIARSPWTRQDAQHVVPPGYRHLRILYPALAWAMSGGGEPRTLLWVMPAINVAAIMALSGLGAVVALRFGRSAWWGVLVPLLLNATNPALRNLTDPLSLAAAFGLLTAWLLRWNAWVLVLCSAAAVFSREQNLVLVGIVMLAALLARDWGKLAGLGVVLIAWCGWVACLWYAYQAPPFISEAFGTPLSGVLYRLQRPGGDAAALGAKIHLLGLAYIGAMVLVAFIMPLLRANLVLALTALAGAAMAILARPEVFIDGHSYTRVFAFLPLGILIWSLQTGRRWPVLSLAPALLMPLYTLRQIWTL